MTSMPIELPVEKWAGKVREVTIGATSDQGGTRARTLTIGGEAALPYLLGEGALPHPTALATEGRERKPGDWRRLPPRVERTRPRTRGRPCARCSVQPACRWPSSAPARLTSIMS